MASASSSTTYDTNTTEGTTYTVTISHYWAGGIEVRIVGAGGSESDRASIAWALRQAATMVERGHPVERELYS